MQNIFYKKWFWGLWEYCGYLVIEILYETTWKWTMYFKYINLWAFDVGLPLCYNIGDYLIFVTMSVWRVITPSLWWWTRLEPFTLHGSSKSLGVWVRPLPIGPKDHMQKGCCMTRHSLPFTRGIVNPWVCRWGYVEPIDHMQKMYYMAHYPILPMGGECNNHNIPHGLSISLITCL